MSFDPSKCGITIAPFPPGHLLTDDRVPDPLGPIKDCNAFEIPVLFPEALCAEIGASSSQIHFNTTNRTDLPERLSVAQASEGCIFNATFDLNPPCLEIEADGKFNYVPFSQGVDARLTSVTKRSPTDSASLRDYCYLGIDLEIDIPAQPCPSILPGSKSITRLPPGEPSSLVVTVTKVFEDSDSIHNTSCAFVVDLNLQVPCTGVEIEGSEVSFHSGSGGVPGGLARIVTLSAIPCEFDFRVLLDLDGVAFDPLVAPTITDLCITPEGKLKSAEVTYYIWPTGKISTKLWRSQFGYCDENGCFSVPLDYGLFNTGCDSNNHALNDVCQNDPHWQCDGSAAKVVKFDAYPTLWMRPGRRSRWIAKTCPAIEASGVTQTFSTTCTLPSMIPAEGFALEGVLDLDNWAMEIRVNGTPVTIHKLTDTFPGDNEFSLRGPMYRFLLKGPFTTGVNLIEFDVNSTDFIGGGQPTWLGFRLEWTGVGICNTRHTTTTTSDPFTTTTSTTTTSTSSTTPVPDDEDCPCYFETGQLVKVIIELEPVYTYPGDPDDCSHTEKTTTVINGDASWSGNNVLYWILVMCYNNIDRPAGVCAHYVYAGLNRFPCCPWGPDGPSSRYFLNVQYTVSKGTPADNGIYMIANWQIPYVCTVDCDPTRLLFVSEEGVSPNAGFYVQGSPASCPFPLDVKLKRYEVIALS